MADRNAQLQAFSSDLPNALVLRLETSLPSLVRTGGVGWLPKKNFIEPSSLSFASLTSRAAATGKRYFVSRAALGHGVASSPAKMEALRMILFIGYSFFLS